MIREYVIVFNEAGFHARAAARFVNLASTFDSQIRIRRDNLEVNGKSILGILQLGASRGTRLELRIEGEDEAAAFEQLKAMIERRFGEGK